MIDLRHRSRIYSRKNARVSGLWLPGGPENHPALLHLFGEFLQRPVPDHISHAVLDARGLLASAGTPGAEVTVLRWEWQEGQVRLPIWLHRDCLDDLHPYLLLGALVLLGAGDLAGEAACAVLVVDEKPVPFLLRH